MPRRKSVRYGIFYKKFKIPKEDMVMMKKAEVHFGFTEDKSIKIRRSPVKVWTRIYDTRPELVFEQIVLASLAICAVPEPGSIFFVNPYGTTPTFIHSFIQFCPISVVQQIKKSQWESDDKSFGKPPKLLIVMNPSKQKTLMNEALGRLCPVIGIMNVKEKKRNSDVAIRCNTTTDNSLAVIWWMLAREISRLKGSFRRNQDFNTQSTIEDFGSVEINTLRRTDTGEGCSNLAFNEEVDDEEYEEEEDLHVTTQRIDSDTGESTDQEENPNQFESAEPQSDDSELLGAVGGVKRRSAKKRRKEPRGPPPPYSETDPCPSTSRQMERSQSDSSLQSQESSVSDPPSYSDITPRRSSVDSMASEYGSDTSVSLQLSQFQLPPSSPTSLPPIPEGSRFRQTRDTGRRSYDQGKELTVEQQRAAQFTWGFLANQSMEDDHQFVPALPGYEGSHSLSSHTPGRFGIAAGPLPSRRPPSSGSQRRSSTSPGTGRPPIYPRTPNKSGSSGSSIASSPSGYSRVGELPSPDTRFGHSSTSPSYLDLPPSHRAPPPPSRIISPSSGTSAVRNLFREDSRSTSPASVPSTSRTSMSPHRPPPPIPQSPTGRAPAPEPREYHKIWEADSPPALPPKKSNPKKKK